MSFADLQTQFRAEQRTAFAMHSPNAHFKPSSLLGCSVIVSQFVPEGIILMVNGRLHVDCEYTVLRLLHGYSPLLSKYTLGTKEAERDGRHHP